MDETLIELRMDLDAAERLLEILRMTNMAADPREAAKQRLQCDLAEIDRRRKQAAYLAALPR